METKKQLLLEDLQALCKSTEAYEKEMDPTWTFKKQKGIAFEFLLAEGGHYHLAISTQGTSSFNNTKRIVYENGGGLQFEYSSADYLPFLIDSLYFKEQRPAIMNVFQQLATSLQFPAVRIIDEETEEPIIWMGALASPKKFSYKEYEVFWRYCIKDFLYATGATYSEPLTNVVLYFGGEAFQFECAYLNNTLQTRVETIEYVTSPDNYTPIKYGTEITGLQANSLKNIGLTFAMLNKDDQINKFLPSYKKTESVPDVAYGRRNPLNVVADRFLSKIIAQVERDWNSQHSVPISIYTVHHSTDGFIDWSLRNYAQKMIDMDIQEYMLSF